jgi:hypothetical protein
MDQELATATRGRVQLVNNIIKIPQMSKSKQMMSDILKIIINSILLQDFSSISQAPSTN